MDKLRLVRSKIMRIINKDKFASLIVGVVIVTLLFTTISVYIYYAFGFSKLDLSRPGLERERSELAQNEPQRSYNTTDTIDQVAIDEFLDEYDQRVATIKTFGDFKTDALSIKELTFNGAQTTVQ